LICKEFNKLPNDPAVEALTDLQRGWILGNIIQDNRRDNKAMKGHGENVKSEELGLDDSRDFEEFSRKMKEEANKQIVPPPQQMREKDGIS